MLEHPVYKDTIRKATNVNCSFPNGSPIRLALTHV